MFSLIFQVKNLFFIVVFSIFLGGGCAVEAAKDKNIAAKGNAQPETPVTSNGLRSESSKPTIAIAPNSPADTVRSFYKHLRERKFREAMFLTNLRPAIEGLTDAELKDLQVDFEPLAAQIPADIEINGEIISDKRATVTAKLPDNETDELKIQEINLRRENDVWIILTVDEKAEATVRKEGANYFFSLRVETHHKEAKAMLERVNKAQMVYATQNNGRFTDIPALVDKGFLPKDILTAQTTGYNYQIQLSSDRKKFTATAAPAVYGKTGKLTYYFEVNGSKTSSLKNKDTKGQTLKM